MAGPVDHRQLYEELGVIRERLAGHIDRQEKLQGEILAQQQRMNERLAQGQVKFSEVMTRIDALVSAQADQERRIRLNENFRTSQAAMTAMGKLAWENLRTWLALLVAVVTLVWSWLKGPE